MVLSNADSNALLACDRAGEHWYPGQALAGNALRLSSAGYLLRNGGLAGGYSLTSSGKDRCARIRAVRLLERRE